MFMNKVRVVGLKQFTTSKPYALVDPDNTLMIGSTLYQDLGSIVKNTTITETDDPQSAYQEFMQDMNALYAASPKRYLTTDERNALIKADEYFGTLGARLKYPIKKDIIQHQSPVKALYRPPLKGA